MLNPYNMQQQQGAMGMNMGMGLGGQYAQYVHQQGPSQHYGDNNIFECNAWQAYQFGTQDELQQVFMMEASISPATPPALHTEDLMNVMNNTLNISLYYGINWSREMCSIMIAVFGRSRDGFMQWPEFLELQEYLVGWFNDFMQYDVNMSGLIEAHEVVDITGYQLQPATMTTLLNRFSHVEYDLFSNTDKTYLTFEDFVSVCVRMRAYTDFAVGITSFLMDDSWRFFLEPEFEKPYFHVLENKLELEYEQGKTIFPPKDLIFNALNLTPLDKVKVVILGQDPYVKNDQAMGLSFSVPKGTKVPPSLKNIYKELEADPYIYGFNKPDHGCLEKWAKDGVLLLNATLTVEARKSNSHKSFGWQKFTDHVIKTVSDCGSPAVFILWGGFAHKKEKLIDKSKHKVIKTAHPSPLSLNKFKGCRCFSECNKSLKEIGQTPIDWSL